MSRRATRPEVTHLSTKGQLIIPKGIRESQGWTAGMELIVENQGNSVVLRRAQDLPASTVEELIGCAGYVGPARTLEDMEAGIARGARERR